jgi:hypothetical protein
MKNFSRMLTALLLSISALASATASANSSTVVLAPQAGHNQEGVLWDNQSTIGGTPAEAYSWGSDNDSDGNGWADGAVAYTRDGYGGNPYKYIVDLHVNTTDYAIDWTNSWVDVMWAHLNDQIPDYSGYWWQFTNSLPPQESSWPVVGNEGTYPVYRVSAQSFFVEQNAFYNQYHVSDGSVFVNNTGSISSPRFDSYHFCGLYDHYCQKWAMKVTSVHLEYTALNAPAVPEPGTYAMLFAGLGLMGFMARRRRKA